QHPRILAARSMTHRNIGVCAAGHTARAVRVVAIAATVLASSHLRAVPMQQSTALRMPSSLQASRATDAAASPVLTAPPDSIETRRALRAAIERFQNEWRREWEDAEMERHSNINLLQIERRFGSLSVRDNSLELQRYLAIYCFLQTGGSSGSLSNVRPGMMAMQLVVDRMISPDNRGPVCPSWARKEESIPPDEGESIDLALPAVKRSPLRRKRADLLQQLEDAHVRFPGDEWIAGQRVRFAIDQRPIERALEAVAACRGTTVRCSVLRGLVMEQARDIPAAERAFQQGDSLLRQAVADSTCVDPDLLLLLPSNAREGIMSAGCDARRALESALWWLSDPLWSVPGNERYVAHSARRAHVMLRAEFDRDERYIWARNGGGAAMQELVIRYGWPSYTYWGGFMFDVRLNRERMDLKREAHPPYTAKEYTRDRVTLVPEFAAVRAPYQAVSSNWEVEVPAGKDQDDWWPQEHMRLGYRLASLPAGQQILLRRDSMMLYAHAFDVRSRTVDRNVADPSNALLMGSTSRTDIRMLASVALDTAAVLRLTAPLSPVPVVLSVEIPNRTPLEPAYRTRFGVQPSPALRDMRPGEVALSDPVVLRLPNRTSTAPSDMPSVLRLMAGDLTFSRRESLAMYWESYGFPVNDSLQLQMRIVRDDRGGVTRRALSAIGVMSELRDSLSVNWTEQNSAQGTSIPTAGISAVGRSIAVGLGVLPAGEYIVSFEVRRGPGMVARGSRRIVLRDD
ncbi:MAG TPA: hypothetical protein VE869_00395, partial [Gemmatimonas sp.]|nr:hypothetical protein [Gemmatimonas sp.]